MTDKTETVALETAPATASKQQLRNAFLRAHRLDAQTHQYTMQNAIDVVALSELLIAKGLIGVRELQERRDAATEQLLKVRSEEYVGPTLYPSPPDSDTDAPGPDVIVDCDTRYALCGAHCCKLYSVYLTAEEVQSGEFRWDLEHPYRLERRADGSCTYLDANTNQCTIHDRRPTVCRQYHCKSDENIWVDFNKRISTGIGNKP